jgi:hypothetical protein
MYIPGLPIPPMLDFVTKIIQNKNASFQYRDDND